METGDTDTSAEAKRVHIDNLYRMVQYCENKTDCRRAQQLEYFGEVFDRNFCKADKISECDNCQAEVCVILKISSCLALYMLNSYRRFLACYRYASSKYPKTYMIM